MSQLPPDIAPSKDLLQQYVAQHFPDKINPLVGGLERISDGWENDVYAFPMECGPIDHRSQQAYILRVYPGNDRYEKSAREYRALARLRAAGYPVPQVFHLERDQSPFGRPFLIMEKIEGEDMWPLLFQNKETAAAMRYETLFCELFVQLHRLDWRQVIFPAEIHTSNYATDLLPGQFQYGRQLLAEVGFTGLLRLLDWLLLHQQEVGPPALSLVHWDFHPKNIIVSDPSRQGGSPAYVIDWTTLEVADFRFDLAWTLTLILAYQGSEARNSILRVYEQVSDRPVDNLAFFEVAAGLRRLFSILYSMKKGAEHLGMRPGAENVMRGQRAPVERIYTHLQSICGFDIPEVEDFLKS